MTLRSSVMLLFCVSSVGIAIRSQRSSVGGNYRLLICREGCGEADTSRAYIVGTLALSDTAIRSQQEKFLFYLVPSDTVLRSRRVARLAANGCFQLDRIKEMGDSYAGIIEGARIHWRRIARTDTIVFPLYRSPDAGYTVKLVQAGETFKGTGRSWGAGTAAIAGPDDSILATRIGDADAAQCLNRR